MKKLKLFTILSSFLLLASCGSGGTTNNSNNGGNTPFNPFIPGGTTSQTVNPGTTSTNPFNPIIPGTTSQSTPSYNTNSVANKSYENNISGYNARIRFSSNGVEYSTTTSTVTTVIYGTFTQNGDQINMVFTSGSQTYNGQTEQMSMNQTISATVSGDYLILTYGGVTETFTVQGGGSVNPSNPSVTPTNPSVAPNPTPSSLSGRKFSTNYYGYYYELSFGNNDVTFSTVGSGMEGYTYGTYSVSGNSIYMYFTSTTTTYNGDTNTSYEQHSLNATLSGSTITLSGPDGTTLNLTEGGGSYTPTNPSVTPSTSTDLSGRSFGTSMQGMSLTVSFSGNQVTYYTTGEGMTSYVYGTYSVSGNQVTMNFTSMNATYNGQTYNEPVSQTLYGTVSGSTLSMTMEGVTVTLTEGGNYVPSPTTSIAPSAPSNLSGKTYATSMAAGFTLVLTFSGNQVTYYTEGEGMTTYVYGTYSVSGNQVIMNFTSAHATYNGQTYDNAVSQSLTGTLSGSTLTMTMEGVTVTLYDDSESAYTPEPTQPSYNPNAASIANRSFTYSTYGSSATITFSGSSYVQMAGQAESMTYYYTGSYTQNGNYITMNFTSANIGGQTTSFSQQLEGALSGNTLSVVMEGITINFTEN